MKGVIALVLASTLPFAIVLAADQAPPDQAAEPPPVDSQTDATLRLEGGSVAAGIGYVLGTGTVNYQGADHKFRISGVSVVDVGGAKIEATGLVMHLGTLGDFSGTYVA
jgi:hypothetical protein